VSEYRSVLERAATHAPEPDLPLERVLRRRDRRRRNQRITAGVVGIAVFVAVAWIVTGRFFDRAQTPMNRPTQTPRSNRRRPNRHTPDRPTRSGR
jgi:ferric-dicitrate binding protein FerR (iron transport regulator)